MAILTDITSLYVSRVFTCSVSAVMAAKAIARYVDVVKVGRQPGGSGMTIITIIAAGNVRRILAGRRNSVMTGAARSQNLRMVDSKHWHPDVRGMAVLTHVARLHMGRVLTRCVDTVVAADTVTRDIDVIKIRGQPGGCGMTIIAIIAACNVRRVFTRRSEAIVTGAAGAGDLCMVDKVGWRPDIRVVTVFANIGCLNMCQVLAGCFRPVVAADAVTCDVDVVKNRRSPGDRGVAIVTSVVAGDVGRVLANRCDTIVTRATHTHNLSVVDGKHRREHIGVVAVFADVARLYVCWILAGSIGAVVAIDTIPRNIHMVEVCRQPASC